MARTQRRALTYTCRVFVRRLIALPLFALFTVLATAACTIEGAGTKTECNVNDCTVTFDRGVDAKASVLGVDAELVAVEGDVVTLRVGGQEVTVPVQGTQESEGRTITVREVTDDKVVVEIATGLEVGN